MDGRGREEMAMTNNKNAGRAAPPGDSLFSSLFNVAARGGKSPRVFDCVLIVCHYSGSVKASFLRCAASSLNSENSVHIGPVPSDRRFGSMFRRCVRQ